MTITKLNAANADTATKLETARTVRTNLASTQAVSFDGTANVTPGVTGTLPQGNGGTGVTGMSSLFAVTEVTVWSNQSVAAGNYKAGTATQTKTGWYPLCVAGFYSNSHRVPVSNCRLSARSAGSVTVNATVGNWHSSAVSMTLIVYVLWVYTG